MNVVACLICARFISIVIAVWIAKEAQSDRVEYWGNHLRVNPTNFLTELKRPNVYRAAVAYGVVAWFLTQLTTQVLPFFEIPNSAVRFVVVALAVGFPIAMSNPATALESLPVKTAEKGTFTPLQVSKLACAANDDWRGAILLGYYTGARLSDVANMRWSAIEWSNKIIRFTASKTGKAVTLPLHSQLERELLKNAGVGNAPMFPALAGKGTGGKHGLSGRFNAIMEKACVEGKRTRASGGRSLSSLSFHSLRHSFNSALANAGVSQEIRQKLTGHASAEMNTIYTDHELAPLRAASGLFRQYATDFSAQRRTLLKTAHLL